MSFRMIGHSSAPAWKDSDPAPDLAAELAYIAVADREYRPQWEKMALPGYELAYVRDGSLLLWKEDGTLRAGPGDIFVTPPRVLHREETPLDSFSEVIYLGALFRRASGRQCLFPLPIDPLLHLGPGHVVEQRLLQIMAEMQSRVPGYTRIVSGAILEIFWNLARISVDITLPEPVDPADLFLFNFGREAEQYIAGNYAEPISIDAVAEHFHLSRQYFSKLFRRVTGRSPHAYLTEVRIRRAQELLALPDLSIQDVATNVGFSDPYYFSRCFRKHTKMTPSAYRQRMLESEKEAT